MPYITRDASGQIIKATTRAIPGVEVKPYNDPELQEFMKKRGQDPSVIDEALTELRRTDADMSRAVEDVIMALFKKNILKMTDLPKPVQDRMALRVRLRALIQDAYDQASGQSG